jgi:hypothetical protein
MAKKKTAKQRDSTQIAVTDKTNEVEATSFARTVLHPVVQATLTLKDYSNYRENLELEGLAVALTEQTQAATAGDLGRGEAMLTAQAHSLDAIFNNLAQRAINSKHIDNLDRYLKLALRAQSQCRSTLEALTAIKNPPMMGYVGQANISQGPQQVNNGPITAADSSCTRENSKLKNKLLEENDEERLDIGAASAASQADPAVAALGKVNRPKDAER